MYKYTNELPEASKYGFRRTQKQKTVEHFDNDPVAEADYINGNLFLLGR